MKNDLHLVCPHCQSINRVPTENRLPHYDNESEENRRARRIP